MDFHEIYENTQIYFHEIYENTQIHIAKAPIFKSLMS